MRASGAARPSSLARSPAPSAESCMASSGSSTWATWRPAARALPRRDPRYLRPAEVDVLCADPSKAERALGWKAKIRFPELVRRMVAADLELAAREKRAPGWWILRVMSG